MVKLKAPPYTAEYWHGRAEKALALAERMTSSETRTMMRGVAADYAKLAEHAARRAQAKAGGKPWAADDPVKDFAKVKDLAK
jgi:hypothetical protein